MAKKRASWEMLVLYGTAGTTAATAISANVTDVDPGVGQWEFSDNPDRGDGTKVPVEDNIPVKRTYNPTFSMIYHDTDANMIALLLASNSNPPVGKSFVFKRYTGGAAIIDDDFYITHKSPGPLADGQKVDFELKRTSAYGATVPRV